MKWSSLQKEWVNLLQKRFKGFVAGVSQGTLTEGEGSVQLTSALR